MEKQEILFLSHTQISDDSRILKAMSVSEKLQNTNVSAVGISARASSSIKAEKSGIIDIDLNSRSLDFLPKIIRHILSLLEYYLKTLYIVRSKSVNIVYCNDDTALPLSVIIKSWKSARLIYDAHELESDRNGISKLHGRLVKFIEYALWRYVDHFITVSPSISNWYKSSYGSKDMTIIYNTPKIQAKDEKIISFREKYNLSDDQKVFLYLGKIMPGRGLESLLDTFSKLDDKYCFVLLGDGHQKLELELRAKKLGCKNVFFHDPVPHDRVVSLAATADYGLCLLENVSTSDYLSLPNKLFEYTFAGLTIIASDFPEIANYLRNVGCGKVVRAEAEIYEIIKNISAGEGLKPNYAYLNKFTWEAQRELLKDVFERNLRE